MRLTEVQRDIGGLVALAQAAGVAVALRNTAGDNVGAPLWDVHWLIRGMNPAAIGFAFDPAGATAEGGAGGWLLALRLALPRLKMLAVRDFVWSKEGGTWKMTPCPLGEGMVDWPRVFSMLARVRFTGPISIHMDYTPKEEITAMRRDVEFIRKQVSAAYV
jgi:sugar phosphate isomerase/epimerase